VATTTTTVVKPTSTTVGTSKTTTEDPEAAAATMAPWSPRVAVTVSIKNVMWDVGVRRQVPEQFEGTQMGQLFAAHRLGEGRQRAIVDVQVQVDEAGNRNFNEKYCYLINYITKKNLFLDLLKNVKIK
jgi:hypothetical protein